MLASDDLGQLQQLLSALFVEFGARRRSFHSLLSCFARPDLESLVPILSGSTDCSTTFLVDTSFYLLRLPLSRSFVDLP